MRTGKATSEHLEHGGARGDSMHRALPEAWCGAARDGSVGREVFDSMPEQLALLDDHGTVVDANSSWVRGPRGNRARPFARAPIGANCLAFFQRSAKEEPAAARALKGIRAVLSGAAKKYRLQHAVSGPLGKRWNVMLVVPIKGPAGGAIVSCT